MGKNGNVPPTLATVYGLTTEFNDTGTAFWRTKTSRRNQHEQLSILETLDENNAAFGTFSGIGMKRQPDLDPQEVLPNPCPQSVTSRVWAETTAIARLAYNRIIVYDGRRLHNQFLEPDACSKLSVNASKGRLTGNTFYHWKP